MRTRNPNLRRNPRRCERDRLSRRRRRHHHFPPLWPHSQPLPLQTNLQPLTSHQTNPRSAAAYESPDQNPRPLDQSPRSLDQSPRSQRDPKSHLLRQPPIPHAPFSPLPQMINGHFMGVDSFPMMPFPPNLRDLRLRSTLIRNSSLSHILSSCPLLNTLVLNGYRYYSSGPAVEITHISSPCLRELTIASAFYDNAALSIEEAPNLEILMLDEIFTKQMPLKVVNAPKLRQLGVVNANVWMLEFGHTRFRVCCCSFSMSIHNHVNPINLNTRMHSLTTLMTRVNLSDAYQAKILAGLLTCFPCLETLNILNDGSDSSDPVDSQYWEQEDSFACQDCHLKYVKIKGFLGDEFDLGFAKFLVKNVLALMMIYLLCLDEVYLTKIEEETRLHELGYENRASLDLRVIFLMD